MNHSFNIEIASFCEICGQGVNKTSNAQKYCKKCREKRKKEFKKIVQKKYRDKNNDKIKERDLIYLKNNKEKRKESCKNYYYKNKKSINKKKTACRRLRDINSPTYWELIDELNNFRKVVKNG